MFPIHLDLGFNQIYFYEGLYFLISIGLGVYVCYRWVKAYGGRLDLYEGLVTWAIIGALIGARLSHFLFWNLDLFLSNPAVLFSITGAGNSITGGLIGGMLGGYFYTKRKRLNYFEYFSLLSPGILIGQAVGRLGCFLNGDAYGTATDSVFGMSFPRYGTWIPSFEQELQLSSSAWRWSFEQGLVDANSTMSAALHPTQLYEMVGDFALLAIVIIVFKNVWPTKKNSPIIFYIHTGGYALLRFFMEFMRGDREFVAFANMTNLQLSLLAYVLIASILWWKYQQKAKAA
jgi:phosphatidylglycerol:prolipoprotein diacylglycerol transferase